MDQEKARERELLWDNEAAEKAALSSALWEHQHISANYQDYTEGICTKCGAAY